MFTSEHAPLIAIDPPLPTRAMPPDPHAALPPVAITQVPFAGRADVVEIRFASSDDWLKI